MGFLQKIFPHRPKPNYGKFLNFRVKCKRCGEIIEGQINLSNDPSPEYDPKGRLYYVCRKVLMGSGKMCFQQIETQFFFNEQRGVIEKRITGGEFVEE